VSEEEEIVVGVVGDFFFALSLAGTFGPPQEERGRMVPNNGREKSRMI
jgi:hypothetical protein